MARDVAKSFGDEPGTGKLYAVCIVLAVIAHFLPWRLTSLGMFGEGNEMGFKIGALGVISGTLLLAAIAGFARTLLVELTPTAKRNHALLLVALTVVAAVLQLVFFFRTGGTQQGPFGLTLKDPQSAAWGFYIALLATLAATVLGVLRMKGQPSAAVPEAPAPPPPAAPPANPQ